MAKQVYPTNEIAHLWMHQTQTSARNPQSNFYFDGDTIYSYGSHFPIARLVSRGKRRAVLFTTRTYSNTTAKHLSFVRRAIPDDAVVLHVPVVVSRWCDPKTDSTIKENSEYFARVVKQARVNLSAAKSKPSKVKRYRELVSVLESANQFREFYKLGKPYPLPANHAELDAIVEDQNAKAEDRRIVRDRNRRARYTAQETARQEAARKRAESMPELLQAWKDGVNPPELPYWELQRLPAMLRLSSGGDEVETSHGARVPVVHAVAVLGLVRKLKAGGKTYQRNGHTIHIGHYPLDSFDSDGTLHAGCHHIPWSEIERFSAVLDQWSTDHEGYKLTQELDAL